VIPTQYTQGVVNNQRAAGTIGSKTMAGQGLSRGKAQSSMDAYRSGVSRAQSEGAAQQTQNDDQLFNASNNQQRRMDSQNLRLQYDTLAQRATNGAWDARFNNLQTAWGALAGLLR